MLYGRGGIDIREIRIEENVKDDGRVVWRRGFRRIGGVKLLKVYVLNDRVKKGEGMVVGNKMG